MYQILQRSTAACPFCCARLSSDVRLREGTDFSDPGNGEAEFEEEMSKSKPLVSVPIGLQPSNLISVSFPQYTGKDISKAICLIFLQQTATVLTRCKVSPARLLTHCTDSLHDVSPTGNASPTSCLRLNCRLSCCSQPPPLPQTELQSPKNLDQLWQKFSQQTADNAQLLERVAIVTDFLLKNPSVDELFPL